MFWQYKTSDLLERAAFISCRDIEDGFVTTRRFEKRNGKWGGFYKDSTSWYSFGDHVSLMVDFINSKNYIIDKDPKYYTTNGNQLKVNFWGKIYETS